MKLFRNAEVKRTFFLYCLLAVAATVGAFLWNSDFGLFTLMVCALFLGLFLLSTYRRYKRIAELAADVNRILHDDNHISLEKYAEGELAILQSEIYKMTVRLREQQQNLQNDKIYLADSIADISHQIRTPLTSINLLVSLLSEPDLSAERKQQLTHELYELLSRIDWLITALLKISKLDAGTVQFKKETLSLDELLAKATAPLLVPMELREQKLELTAEGNFSGDIAWTCEALTNIIKNCMEHTPESGSISVNASENALYTEITVTDTGSGIAKEDLPHIFERFYKGKNSDDKSFGIGLALARMIITAQNGTVKAENRPPESTGAKFTIRFYKGTI